MINTLKKANHLDKIHQIWVKTLFHMKWQLHTVIESSFITILQIMRTHSPPSASLSGVYYLVAVILRVLSIASELYAPVLLLPLKNSPNLHSVSAVFFPEKKTKRRALLGNLSVWLNLKWTRTYETLFGSFNPLRAFLKHTALSYADGRGWYRIRLLIFLFMHIHAHREKNQLYIFYQTWNISWSWPLVFLKARLKNKRNN